MKEEDFDELEKFLECGWRNGVFEMRIVDRDEFFYFELGFMREVIGVLWVLIVGQIGLILVVIVLVENVVVNGVKIYFEMEVRGIKVENGEVKGVEINNGFIEVDIVINVVGFYVDEIVRMVGIDYFEIYLRKGEYYFFDDDVFGLRRVFFFFDVDVDK